MASRMLELTMHTRPKEWHTVRCDFDVAARKTDIYLDGQNRANQLPWQKDATSVRPS